MNANIIKTQFIDKIKYDLKGNICLFMLGKGFVIFILLLILSKLFMSAIIMEDNIFPIKMSMTSEALKDHIRRVFLSSTLNYQPILIKI